MGPHRWALLLALADALASLSWAAGTVRVENTAGNITVRVERREKPGIRHAARGRATQPGDIRIEEDGGMTTVRAGPADGAAVDIDVVLPYGVYIEASTTKGSISSSGLIFRARFTTDTGDMRVAAPWSLTRVVLTSLQEPRDFVRPRRLGGHRSSVAGLWGWTSDVGGLDTCCEIRISGRRPGKVEFVDMPPPSDSPVKLPQQASAVLDAILGGGLTVAPAKAEPEFAPAGPSAADREGKPVFQLGVGLVNLAVAVYDSDGHPETGLRPDEFELLEDGLPQQPIAVTSGETEVNLALLLDLGLSPSGGRTLLEEAERQFLEVKRPQDRAAVYALARGFFWVGSWLTQDRQRLEGLFEPMYWYRPTHARLYDTITLACAEEMVKRPRERNALVVVSPGFDGQVTRQSVPSAVPFQKLRRAAAEMPILIYPVLMPYYGGTAETRTAARENMQALADASGGRMFTVKTTEDLKPLAAQVADELRSVYTLAFYPKNQNFDGKWRQITVRVKRPGVKFRARPGYYARQN